MVMAVLHNRFNCILSVFAGVFKSRHIANCLYSMIRIKFVHVRCPNVFRLEKLHLAWQLILYAIKCRNFLLLHLVLNPKIEYFVDYRIWITDLHGIVLTVHVVIIICFSLSSIVLMKTLLLLLQLLWLLPIA